MPTNITQVEDPERGKTLLRVDGAMTLEDAVLLEKIALEMREATGKNLTLDLADLHFMDSESAPVLRRIEREHGFQIEGIEHFVSRIVEETEAKSA
jgi:anti-anti-sigma regulatory factor